MRGDLSETPAADACRQLAGGGATGVLSIDGPEGSGSVTLAGGDIVGATSPIPRARLGDRLVGAGFLDEQALTAALASQDEPAVRSRLGAVLVERSLAPPDAVRLFVQEQTLDALFELLRWRYGAFVFTPTSAVSVPEVAVAIRVEDALAEVARRHEQWAELSSVIPDLEAVPSFRADPANAVASLEPDEFAVLASIDGDRSIRALATALGYGEYELARIVYGLVVLGVVDIELPEDEIGAALEDAMAYTGHDVPPAEVPDVDRDGDHDRDLDGDRDPERDVERGGTVVESDLPESTFSDVLRELRGLDEDLGRDRGEAAAAPPPPPTAPPATDPPPHASPPRSTPPEDTSGGPPHAPGAPHAPGREERDARTDDDGDVAEFLRELSRLALDDAPEAPERPRPRAAPSSPPRSAPREDDPKPKRRGLFGRG